MLDVQSRAFRKEWNLDYVCVIPPNIYGPEDNFSLTTSHVLCALIHRCFLAKQKNEDLVVWGSGRPLREFVLCDDVAKLTLRVLEDYSEEYPILVSSGIETSIADLVQIIVKVMDFKGKVIYDATKPDGQHRKPSDVTKLKKYYPDFTWTPVEQGLEITIKWFLRNYPKVKM
jgi:GDP-L-fucose synthase